MPQVLRLALLVAAVTLAAEATAGDWLQSTSSRPGLFMANFDDNPVRMIFKDEAHFRSLALHCNAGKDVFSLQTGVKANCKIAVSGDASAPVSWDERETTVQLSSDEGRRLAFGVFSLTPPRTVGWAIRQTTIEEVDGLHTLLASDKQKFAKLAQELKFNDAIAVGKPGDQSFLVIVPGRVVEEDEGMTTYHFHHVFVRRDGPYSYLGEIDKPYYFVDLDGGDLPAVVSVTDCDGTCAGLIRITFEKMEGVAWLSGH